jgi:tryptophan synthase alpha chain
MSKIDELFASLKRENKKAFMPFVTAGDPNLEFTEKLLTELDAAGCQLAEIGVPYSDPIADGPVIQASYTRALDGGAKLNQIFEMLARVTQRIEMPVVTMVSYAIIFRVGVDEFLKRAIESGVSGAIVPDLPVDESAELAEKCRELDFSLIQLVTPTTPRPRAVQIAQHTTGFIYYVSVTGITGERTELPPELSENILWLKTQTDLPICVGFGISQPEHVNRLKSVADGLIVGSAIVKRIGGASDGKSAATVLTEVVDFAKTMLAEVTKISEESK